MKGVMAVVVRIVSKIGWLSCTSLMPHWLASGCAAFGVQPDVMLLPVFSFVIFLWITQM